MQGLLVFRSLSEALREGFLVYDRYEDGYLVRRRGRNAWELALVQVRR